MYLFFIRWTSVIQIHLLSGRDLAVYTVLFYIYFHFLLKTKTK